jgi:hypothetical protein
MRHFICVLSLSVAAGALLTPALASDSPIVINGQVTLSGEYYRNRGNPDNALYSDVGSQEYGELNMNLSQRRSAYESLRGNFTGLWNRSAFRSSERGLLLERAQITWGKGDTALPFRVQAGDFLGYLSQRTLQRSLIGAQVEVQPLGTHSSILAFAGASDTAYRSFSNDNRFLGLSYLVDGGREQGAFNLNVLHNRRDANAIGAARDQLVTSLAAERNLPLGSHVLTIEAEGALFTGDYDNGGTLLTDRHDTGLYLLLSGRNPKDRSSASYSVRLERYGADYRPAGAAVSANRESIDARYTQPFLEGLRLQARAQHFRDSIEAANPTTTQLLGFNVSGSQTLFQQLFSVRMDTFLNRRQDRNNTTDNRGFNLRTGISTNLDARTVGRLDINYSDNDNRLTNAFNRTGTASVGIDMRRQWYGWQVSLSPSLNFTTVDTSTGDNEQFGYALRARANRGNHQVQFNLRDQRQNPHNAASANVATGNLGLRYRYSLGSSTFGVEFDGQHRVPGPGTNSKAYRVALTFRHSFERTHKPGDTAKRRTTIAADGTTDTDVGLLLPINSGVTVVQARQDLREAGYPEPVGNGEILLYAYQPFINLNARQRVVVIGEAERTSRVGVILDPESAGVDDLNRVLSDLLEIVSARLGTPDISIETGNFNASLAENLRKGTFARLYHWERQGQQIRLGIPLRLDGLIRIELVQSREISTPDVGIDWGIFDIAN